MPIHVGRRASREGWISFETDPLLRQTKKRLEERCLPCLTGLLQQLKAGTGRVRLREAWTCWKVTAVVKDQEEALRLLEAFADRFPNEGVLGKFGGGVGRSTSAVVFHAHSERRRDELLRLCEPLLASGEPGRALFSSRGCSNPYELLLGPWTGWKRSAEILHPERRAEVRARLIDSLYRRAY